jgi:endonuclease YncB( thermonuclease family)
MKWPKQKIFLVFLGLLFLFLPLFSQANGPQTTFTGKVVGVNDGDTIKVMREGKAVKVRLYGIDCPERKQPYGTKAKRYTSEMAFGKEVTVQIKTTDRYGRIVGEVILPGGSSLNKEFVFVGLAWWYRKYAPNDRTLKALEAGARAEKRGLWADPYHIAPWEWRRGKRGHTKKEQLSGQYHGNVKSNIFHRPGCRYYNCKDCTAVFRSREEAIEAGYRPCRVCIP